ncbi:uncharacterized protein BDR25DRAFT_312546 [Lindgomyces ingoldianus]|uniref:Uncharacterized protein n=1 Tax=Lindgomyces ingoldianus TaxID=673940 RepID=A0ACB6R5A7_9PLEO|nr:uncharacterized protein BDR25DRAFT_312546 [Lindgomyces ingoldianus]KAF2473495.1 hypothetical protein BDR25DRAFT_312546 [Lindgomyces ingoldianus]
MNSSPGRNDPLRPLAPKHEFVEGKHIEFNETDELPLDSRGALGRGGEGEVDIVVIKTSATYARKCWKRLNPKTRTRHLKEIELMKRLKPHPHIVQIFGTYSKGNELAIMMSPVAESDLQKALEVGAIPEKTLKQAFGCLVTGLAFIHKGKIIHGDIKPSNILLSGCRFLWTDFGCSKDISGLQDTMTEATMRGTRGYWAPEVFRLEQRGRSADVFSLGCVLMEVWSVLKGHAYMKDNPASFLSLSPYFLRLEGSQSLQSWVEAMEKAHDEPVDNLWLSSCIKMLRVDPKQRPKLAEFLNGLGRSSQRESFMHALFCVSCAEERKKIKSISSNPTVAEPVESRAEASSGEDTSSKGSGNEASSEDLTAPIDSSKIPSTNKKVDTTTPVGSVQLSPAFCSRPPSVADSIPFYPKLAWPNLHIFDSTPQWGSPLRRRESLLKLQSYPLASPLTEKTVSSGKRLDTENFAPTVIDPASSGLLATIPAKAQTRSTHQLDNSIPQDGAPGSFEETTLLHDSGLLQIHQPPAKFHHPGVASNPHVDEHLVPLESAGNRPSTPPPPPTPTSRTPSINSYLSMEGHSLSKGLEHETNNHRAKFPLPILPPYPLPLPPSPSSLADSPYTPMYSVPPPLPGLALTEEVLQKSHSMSVPTFTHTPLYAPPPPLLPPPPPPPPPHVHSSSAQVLIDEVRPTYTPNYTYSPPPPSPHPANCPPSHQIPYITNSLQTYDYPVNPDSPPPPPASPPPSHQIPYTTNGPQLYEYLVNPAPPPPPPPPFSMSIQSQEKSNKPNQRGHFKNAVSFASGKDGLPALVSQYSNRHQADPPPPPPSLHASQIQTNPPPPIKPSHTLLIPPPGPTNNKPNDGDIALGPLPAPYPPPPGYEWCQDAPRPGLTPRIWLQLARTTAIKCRL